MALLQNWDWDPVGNWSPAARDLASLVFGTLDRVLDCIDTGRSDEVMEAEQFIAQSLACDDKKRRVQRAAVELLHSELRKEYERNMQTIFNLREGGRTFRGGVPDQSGRSSGTNASGIYGRRIVRRRCK